MRLRPQTLRQTVHGERRDLDGHRHLPDTYLTDGRTLLYVIERVGADTLLVENAVTGEQLEMGEADLVGYRVVDRRIDDNE